MITYSAEPGTTSHDNLSLLASWAASAASDLGASARMLGKRMISVRPS
jgi:hypothetical protein